MKKNKYIVKFTVPNRWGEKRVFLSFHEIICDDKGTVLQFFEMICKGCINDVFKSDGVTLEKEEIDFQMISLVDSSPIT